MINNDECSLENMSKDNQIILNLVKKNKSNFFDSNCITNKIWNCFIYGDGTMTKNLKFLFNNLKLIVLSKYTITDQDKELVSHFIDEEEFIQDTLLVRKISFNSGEEVKMIGLSYWNPDAYKKLFSNEEEESKPIGLLIIQKEMEYFKSIRNIIIQENEIKFIIRICKYKHSGILAFLLVEIFSEKDFVDIFGKIY
jgi:hypothetical protein